MTWGRQGVSVVEVLGLKEDAVRRRSAAADAWLEYYRSTEKGLHFAGSMAVLGASCWVLTDTITSRDRWQEAANIYAELLHPYAEILSVCAGGAADAGTAALPTTAVGFSCRTLRLAWLSVTLPQLSDSCRAEMDALNPIAERLGARSSGQLLLPASYVYEFSTAIVHDWLEHGVTSRFAAAARRILAHAAVTVASAQRDRYHWRRILPGFMPVEPEWLSIGRITYEAVLRGGESSGIIADDLTDLENLPMHIADVMPPPDSIFTRKPATPAPNGDSGDRSSLDEDANRRD